SEWCRWSPSGRPPTLGQSATLNSRTETSLARERIPMRYLLDLLYFLILLLLFPWLIYQIFTKPKFRRGLLDKLLGRAPVLSPSSRRAWFHGVSVGEIHLLRQVIAAFPQPHPDWGCGLST